MNSETGGPLDIRRVEATHDALLDALNALPECGEAVIFEKDGERLAAMISMQDLELYQRLFEAEEDRRDKLAVEEFHRKGSKTVPFEPRVAKSRTA